MTNELPKLAVFGDSLTEGYALDRDEALPAILEDMLRQEGILVRAFNFGVSGDTAHDGLRRLQDVLSAAPDAVMIEFGANDSFIGEPVHTVRENITALVRAFTDKDIPVLLVGIKAVGEIPQEYRRQFNPIFRELADTLGVPLFPDILAPYFGNPSLTLMDGLHPNEDGVRAMARALLPQVKNLLAPIL